jgi:hypothetical protein
MLFLPKEFFHQFIFGFIEVLRCICNDGGECTDFKWIVIGNGDMVLPVLLRC